MSRGSDVAGLVALALQRGATDAEVTAVVDELRTRLDTGHPFALIIAVDSSIIAVRATRSLSSENT